MNKAPWFPFYPKDWLDYRVLRMSLQAQGAYIRLLAHMWVDSPDGCSLPLKPADLKKILAISNHHWTKVWAELMPKDDPIFTIEDNRIVSMRLRKEKAEQENRSNKARDAANRRWNADALPTDCERNAPRMRTQCISQSHIREEEKEVPQEFVGTYFKLSTEQVARLLSSYPDLDIQEQLKAMDDKAFHDPAYRKGKKKWSLAAHNWMKNARKFRERDARASPEPEPEINFVNPNTMTPEERENWEMLRRRNEETEAKRRKALG